MRRPTEVRILYMYDKYYIVQALFPRMWGLLKPRWRSMGSMLSKDFGEGYYIWWHSNKAAAKKFYSMDTAKTEGIGIIKKFYSKFFDNNEGKEVYREVLKYETD